MAIKDMEKINRNLTRWLEENESTTGRYERAIMRQEEALNTAIETAEYMAIYTNTKDNA